MIFTECKVFVIIVAGGVGKRLGGELPKQFITIKDKPIIVHTIDIFYNNLSNIEIIVSINKDWKEYWLNIKRKFISEKLKTVEGGSERFFSVKNALNNITSYSENDIVIVHDAVRPIVSKNLLSRLLKKTLDSDSAIPYIPVEQTMRKIVDTNVMKTQPTDRNKYILIQTPQVFKVAKLKEAYKQSYSNKFTDDAAVFETKGFKLHYVKGERTNMKITYQDDLQLATCLLY